MATYDHSHQPGWTPQKAREAIYSRQGGLCAKCAGHLGPIDGTWHAHHRLRRGLMPDDAQWCPCDLVALHPIPCHNLDPSSVHGNPAAAHELGLVLHWPEDPRDVPVPEWFYGWGWAFLLCDSSVSMA